MQYVWRFKNPSDISCSTCSVNDYRVDDDSQFRVTYSKHEGLIFIYFNVI